VDKIFKNRIQIFTEDVNRKEMLDFIGLYFEGFNFQTFKGFYKGQIEDSIKFDFWIEDSELIKMNFVVDFIIHNNNQECVGVVDENGQRFVSQDEDGFLFQFFKGCVFNGSEEAILKALETRDKYLGGKSMRKE